MVLDAVELRFNPAQQLHKEIFLLDPPCPAAVDGQTAVGTAGRAWEARDSDPATRRGPRCTDGLVPTPRQNRVSQLQQRLDVDPPS